MQGKAYYAEYYRKNQARILARMKEWRAANSEKIRAKNQQYQQERRYHASAAARLKIKYRERKAVLDRIKAESGCIQCGEKDPVCLEFHHRDPEKRTAQVAALCGFGYKKMLGEVAKCDVLCANCHAKAHHHEWRQPTVLRKRRMKQSELPFDSTF